MEWISVKDRLPEPFDSKNKKFQGILAFVKSESNIYGGYQQILFYGKFSFCDLYGNFLDADEDGEVRRFGWHYERDSEGEFDTLVFDMNKDVTHWMPLPEPPK